MNGSRVLSRMCVASVMLAGAVATWAQDYPVKPVRIITAAVGGGADVAARIVAQGISGPLGQQVITDNRGGSGGMVGGEMVAKAAPDGYTLLVYGNTIWLAPFMRERTPYDPVRDFAPVTLVVSSPSMVVVHPSLPVKTVRELIALAKSRPGKLNYGTSGAGSASHLAGELFKAMAGVDIVRVNYKGAAPAFTDVVAGNVQLTFGSATLATPHLANGRLRALAVTGAQRSALFPNLPAVAESGLPGYEADAAYGMFAPARTPGAIVHRLQQEIARYLKTSEARDRMAGAGLEPVANTPEQFAATVKSDIAKWGKVIRDAGIRDE